jgi:hypothetical protein
VLGLAAAVAGLTAAMVGVPPIHRAQLLAEYVALGCGVVAFLSIIKALYHVSRWIWLRG